MSASSSLPSGDNRSCPQEGAGPTGGTIMTNARFISGTSEILALLRILGEGYRLSSLYRCQVLLGQETEVWFFACMFLSDYCFWLPQDALDVYLKLPPKHYNTGWVLSQVSSVLIRRYFIFPLIILVENLMANSGLVRIFMNNLVSECVKHNLILWFGESPVSAFPYFFQFDCWHFMTCHVFYTTVQLVWNLSTGFCL